MAILAAKTQVAGDQLMRRVDVAVFAPALGQRVFLFLLQNRKLADFLEVPRQVPVWGKAWTWGKIIGHDGATP